MDQLNIEILEEIGGWGFTFQDLYAQAKGKKYKKIRVPVNSYGGSVLEALLIYNFLKGSDAEVEVHIPAFAMSAGTIIAAAGDRVTMAENGYFMIHNPYAIVGGEESDLDRMAGVLGKMKADMVNIYQKKAKNLGKKQIIQMMDDETWLTAQQALEMGFVDELTAGAKFEAAFSSHQFQAYNNVPDGFKALFYNYSNPKSSVKMTAIDNILNRLKDWFNTKHDATAEDVQAAMQEYGTLDDLKASIRRNVEAELTELHASAIDTLQNTHEEAMATAQQTHQEQITALQQQLDTATAALETANAELEQLRNQPAAGRTPGASSPATPSDKKERYKGTITEAVAKQMAGKDKRLPF